DGAAALAIAAAPPPLYPVRLPPAFSGRWRREGGGRDGEFVLDWSPGDGSYRLVLADDAGDGWASRGALGAHGLEPERLVERRRGRDRRAANFRRDVGRISYSGLEQQHALLPGAQDRLSWLAQLAAVVAAAPQRFVPGAAVELFVAGTRGDAALRRFEVVALEALELPAGPVPAALRLASAAPAPYEPKLEVWLDPARGWLPVRWRSEVAANGTVVEQRLLGTAAVTSAGP
ncbi:DUF3108 domain-containing protein, partial [Rubrivivax gelatinosus]|nr:hypothetical protein [Rubrivivax gelatinosus]